MIGPDLALVFLLLGFIIGLKTGRWRADSVIAKKDQALKEATRSFAVVSHNLDRSNKLLDQYAPDSDRSR